MEDTPHDGAAPAGVGGGATAGGDAPLHDDHHPETVSRNARVGLWLFLVYLLLYAGFMGLNAFAPQKMAEAPFGGINLAVLYGLLLIIAAFVLALVYVFLVRRRAEDGGR